MLVLFVLILLVGIPLLEIAVFIRAGEAFGLWPTLAAVILTAIAGTILLRLQGLATIQRARASLDRGEAPVREVFDGACLLIAGLLLLTPGFATDALGLLLFVPPFRELIRLLLARRIAHSEQVWVHGGGPRSGERRGNDVVDVEYEVVDIEAEGLEQNDDDEDHGRDNSSNPPGHKSPWSR